MFKDIDSFLLDLEKEGILIQEYKDKAFNFYSVKGTKVAIESDDELIFATDFVIYPNGVEYMRITLEKFLDEITDRKIKDRFLFNLDLLLG